MADGWDGGATNVDFLRITLIGPSGGGKSALANAFVNNVAIYEHQPTTDLTLYYSRVVIKSDDLTVHALVEIEDTWGSDKVNPDKMRLLQDPWWPLTQKQAMEANRTEKKKKDPGQKSGGRFAVCQCGHGRSDHEGGVGGCKVSPCTCEKFEEEAHSVLNPFSGSRAPELWGVLCSKDHTLKFTPDLDNHGWLCHGKWEENGCKSRFINKFVTKGVPRYRCETCDHNLCERCHDVKAKAISAHTPDPNDVDIEGRKYRPLTRNRMAYFFVFDSNDMESYKQAISQLEALKGYLKLKEIKVQPVVFLVGTKADMDPDSLEFRSVQQSALARSQRDAIRYKEVSAMKFEGVKRLFREAVAAVRGKQQLWMLDHGVLNVDEEQKPADACCLQ